MCSHDSRVIPATSLCYDRFFDISTNPNVDPVIDTLRTTDEVLQNHE